MYGAICAACCLAQEHQCQSPQQQPEQQQQQPPEQQQQPPEQQQQQPPPPEQQWRMGWVSCHGIPHFFDLAQSCHTLIQISWYFEYWLILVFAQLLVGCIANLVPAIMHPSSEAQKRVVR
jgi:hypothetical protein